MDMGVILPKSRIDAMTRQNLWHDKLVLDYLDEVLAVEPDRTAFICYDSENGTVTTLSYAELDKVGRRIGLALVDLGIEKGDVVSFQLPNWWQFVALHIGCVRAGAISNPLMPIFRERELSFMLGFAESKLFVAPQEFRGFIYPEMMAELRPQLPALRHAFFVGGEGALAFETAFLAQAREEAAGVDDIFAARRPGPHDVLELVYTSGTTGVPKGVMHTANTLFCTLFPTRERLGLGDGEVILMSSPMAHQTGFIYGMLQPIMLGGKGILQDRWEPQKAAELIEKHGVTWTMASTPFLNDLVSVGESGNYDFSTLKSFLAAGAPVPPAAVQHAKERLGLTVLSGWGMSENGLVTLCNPGDPPEKIFGTDGLVSAGLEVRVVDDDNRPVSPGTEGLLKVRGSSMFVGYLKRPDLHGHDDEGWFDTGDIARMDDDGYIRICGRSKDIIIRGGENIPIVEVEQVLFRHPAVEDVAIVGAPDDRLGERAWAFVQCKTGQELGFEQMVGYLEDERMAKQYLPERLILLDEFPRTPSGKIQKFKLRERAEQMVKEGVAAAGV